MSNWMQMKNHLTTEQSNCREGYRICGECAMRLQLMKRSVPAEELMHSIGLQKRGQESIGTGPSVGCIKKYQEVYLWRKKYRSGKKQSYP